MAVSLQQLFPKFPVDGQIFIDAYRVRWEYISEEKSWIRIGPALDVPLARSGDCGSGQSGSGSASGSNAGCLGPTNGLLSARFKGLLDSVGSKPGGFGFIFRPGIYLTPTDEADSILTGAVKLISSSLSITCENLTENGCQKRVIRFGLSQDFIDTFCIEVRGGKGNKGATGVKGKAGRHGTGDGPAGADGLPGADILVRNGFTGIKLVESDEVVDTAVVDLVLDADAGVLEVIKSKVAVPANDVPASKVAASPIFRDVEFIGDTLDTWQLVAPTNDPAGEIDVNVIRLPAGWNGSVTNSVPVSTMKLSELVQLVVNYYKAQADTTIAQWDDQVKEFMAAKDAEARTILADLAQELAECEFSKPLSFVIGLALCE